jgi:hypothetical protein
MKSLVITEEEHSVNLLPASLILIALEEKQLVNFISSVYYYFKNRKKEKRRSQIKENVRKEIHVDQERN